jgi:hypothetical protein
MKRKTALFGALAVTLLLAGCGGGGSTSSTTETAPDPTSRSMDATAQATLTGTSDNLETSTRTGGAFLTYSYEPGGAWNWSAYSGGDASTGILRAQATVNSDHSGVVRVFCAEDTLKRAEATWAPDKTGQVCVFDTACSRRDTDSPCIAYPRP